MSDRDVRRERAALNESLFREVNERIEDLAGNAAHPEFVCECIDGTCDRRVAMTVAEYEYVRAEPNRFFVLPGHSAPEVEEVVETKEQYLIVRKIGVGGSIAEDLDPRS
jgi:hypothetical protein